METRINKKADKHVHDFKNHIREWFETNDTTVTGKYNLSDFLKFIYDYDSISFNKDDFQKRKRVKNMVPLQIRCCARRANGEQCTRRKRPECEYCGTHEKGLPYGVIEKNMKDLTITKKLEVWIQDIKGINYYIDDNNNVYNHTDIMKGNKSPQVIAKYCKDSDDNYSIPEFGI